MTLLDAIDKRRTFAIISHPDAGKTTLTEQLLLSSGAIQLAGAVKGKKAARRTVSDWMEMEKQRGISVSTSVMQFIYDGCVLNLLDTPGHADFSEDTYRTLTAVDTVLMVIDVAKGVEERTIKLMEVCRLRNTPIITFINKFDRDGKEPVELLDEIEQVLGIHCAPMTWPIGRGRDFRGVYHLLKDQAALYLSGDKQQFKPDTVIQGLHDDKLTEILRDMASTFVEEVDLLQGACHPFDEQLYQQGQLTPVYVGSAISGYGIKALLDDFVHYARSPQARETQQRVVQPQESDFSAFVFKVQANMDPKHHDRVAFLRICSGKFHKKMRLQHLRSGKSIQVNQAITFMASNREQTDTAYPGDIIGLPNHGTIAIGDTFTSGEQLKFIGIPSFSPELFQLVRPRDPLRMKALLKGLTQLSEEGATQIFRPVQGPDIILGAIGQLQFDVVSSRLHNEYKVDCIYQSIQITCARWVYCTDEGKLTEFKHKAAANLALDNVGQLTYLAPTKVNLDLTMQRWPEIQFSTVREN